MGCFIAEATLSSGHKIPLIGLGTAAYPFGDSKVVKSSILTAIKLGYRHFDTSAAYLTEKLIGEAIAEALGIGLIESRDELFITSKLWCSDAHSDRVIPALKASLRKLQLDYLDLYLIHWPVTSKPGSYDFPVPKEDLLPMDYKSVWEAMEQCQELGLTKSIGVSNYSSKKLEAILANARIPPAVNQVEMNPLWQQKTLLEFCRAKNILVTGYSPLGAKGTVWGTNRVMECEVVKDIANAKGKSHAQICLRWVYEQGVCLLVKSFNAERMKENLEIFDWALNKEESMKISQLPQRRGLSGDVFVSVKGPFRSVDELWDEEI